MLCRWACNSSCRGLPTKLQVFPTCACAWFSISAIISDLEWESLEERREEIKLNMVYKIINGKVILPPDCLPRVNHNRPTRGCSEVPVGAANQLAERPTRLITTGKTFFYSAPQLWNMKVTPSRANAPSIDAFKNQK